MTAGTGTTGGRGVAAPWAGRIGLAVAAASIAAAGAWAGLLIADHWRLVAVVLGVLAARTVWTHRPGRPAPALPQDRVSHLNWRLRFRRRPGPGHANLHQLWQRWGRYAAFRTSRFTRPGLRFWERARHTSNYSVTVGWAQYRHALRVTLEEHLLILAGPRTNKTAMLGRIILRYCGAVFSTSSKTDVYRKTSGTRACKGPVALFNPEGIGNLPSTFRWSPVSGSEDQETANRHAADLAGAVSCEDIEGGAGFWKTKAVAYLQALLHAAAITGRDMRLVNSWCLSSAEDAEGILLAHGNRPMAEAVGQLQAEAPMTPEVAEFVLARQGTSAWAAALRELRSPAERTAATVRMILSSAVSFMAIPSLALSVLPADGDSFDIGRFLRESGTLYLVAKNRDNSPLAPLFACFAGEVHYQARKIAEASRGERLDPPLLMALDEATQICPVPVPSWCTDSGGLGIQIITVAHGEAMLARRWQEHGKQVIIDTAGAIILMPGNKNPETAKMAADLCGDATYTVRGQEHESSHPKMTPEMLRCMLPGRALMIRSHCRPVIAKVPRIFHDPVYMWAKLRGRAMAHLEAAALPAALPEPTAFAGDDAGRPAVRLRPAGEDTPAGGPEVAEVLPADGDQGVPRPWKSS